MLLSAILWGIVVAPASSDRANLLAAVVAFDFSSEAHHAVFEFTDKTIIVAVASSCAADVDLLVIGAKDSDWSAHDGDVDSGTGSEGSETEHSVECLFHFE